MSNQLSGSPIDPTDGFNRAGQAAIDGFVAGMNSAQSTMECPRCHGDHVWCQNVSEGGENDRLCCILQMGQCKNLKGCPAMNAIEARIAIEESNGQ